MIAPAVSKCAYNPSCCRVASRALTARGDMPPAVITFAYSPRSSGVASAARCSHAHGGRSVSNLSVALAALRKSLRLLGTGLTTVGTQRVASSAACNLLFSPHSRCRVTSFSRACSASASGPACRPLPPLPPPPIVATRKQGRTYGSAAPIPASRHA